RSGYKYVNNSLAPSNAPISMEEAHARLSPEYEEFIRIICAGWDSLIEHPANRTQSWRPGTRFSVVNDAIRVDAAVTYYGRENQNIAVFNKSDGLFVVRFGNIYVRFKHLDSQWKTRNIVTIQQQSFREPVALPGCEESTNLTVGYVLNEAQTAIEKILM